MPILPFLHIPTQAIYADMKQSIYATNYASYSKPYRPVQTSKFLCAKPSSNELKQRTCDITPGYADKNSTSDPSMMQICTCLEKIMPRHSTVISKNYNISLRMPSTTDKSVKREYPRLNRMYKRVRKSMYFLHVIVSNVSNCQVQCATAWLYLFAQNAGRTC